LIGASREQERLQLTISSTKSASLVIESCGVGSS
jgi:hypothetical protein